MKYMLRVLVCLLLLMVVIGIARMGTGHGKLEWTLDGIHHTFQVGEVR